MYYSLTLLLVILTSPYLYLAGKRVRRTIPTLPNAQDLHGVCSGYERSASLLFLGESAIAGVGVVSNHDGLAGQVSQYLSKMSQTDVRWDVLAHTGYDAQRVLTDLLPKMAQRDYDIILIQLSANDAFKLHSPWKYKRRMQLIINQITRQCPKAKIIFLTNPPVRDMAFPPLLAFIFGNVMDQYAEVLAHIASKNENHYFMDDKLSLKEWQAMYPEKAPQDFFSDGVHPSAFSYKIWAREIAAYIMTHSIL